jgi:hypothetical protein
MESLLLDIKRIHFGSEIKTSRRTDANQWISAPLLQEIERSGVGERAEMNSQLSQSAQGSTWRSIRIYSTQSDVARRQKKKQKFARATKSDALLRVACYFRRGVGWFTSEIHANKSRPRRAKSGYETQKLSRTKLKRKLFCVHAILGGTTRRRMHKKSLLKPISWLWTRNDANFFNTVFISCWSASLLYFFFFN